MIHPATPGGLFVSLRRPSRGPAVSCFLQACLFKVMFVYAEAGLCETCAGSAPGSFHRGSILFLIKWHSLAGGLAGTQLPGKPKNAALHLATNSFCLRRRLLRSSMLQLLRPVCVRARVCVCPFKRATVEVVRYGIACLLWMFTYTRSVQSVARGPFLTLGWFLLQFKNDSNLFPADGAFLFLIRVKSLPT